ncbi:hypothetical protein C0Z01_09545 [Photobacterium kishitanii]|uniref:hypothetical protein n=1 Tax=Photobacterium kishitanii TaxID=318456 RepID=UPI0007EFB502|nr:hypothetical protein [Photobacterium kishitanii]OBU29227.1 hypothetical protein AYY22_01495 [Photobacterium kishitanii]PSW69710.1 hypothetical protein C0Z01_09545 [Photobacterium kishitanii]
MAAQKLTRGRLIQIIVLMIILITAFVWRTVTYQAQPITKVKAKVCSLNAGNCLFNINNKTVTAALLPVAPKADIPLILNIKNVDIKPSANVSGVSMNMGSLPVIFKQKNDGWSGEFIVPQCTHDNMTWVIDIKVNDNIYSSEFTVTK